MSYPKYIVCKRSDFSAKNFFDSHFVNIGDGLIFVKVGGAREEFLTEAMKRPGAVRLPHILTKHKIGPGIAKALAAFGVNENDTTYDAAQKFAAIHPMMRP